MAKYRRPEKVETYWIETYGCEMNIAESNAIKTMLEGVGITLAADEEHADLAILNTCSVRQSAENRVWGRIGNYSRIKKERPMILMIIGCMAERLKEDLQGEAPWIDYVLGTNDKHKVLEIATGQNNLVHDNSYSFLENYYKEGDFSTFVPIMNGCNNFCTYCIVPYVRGRETSRDPEKIKKDIIELSKNGISEITLLGQNVNSYNYGMDFSKLLYYISDVPGIKRIRFMTSHPKDLSDNLIKAMTEIPSMCNHIHLPLQSGSTEVLRQMNRKYSKEDYLLLVSKIRQAIPEISISTDIIVGFPGETEYDFNETLDVYKKTGFDFAYTFLYSKRTGTPAAKRIDQIDDNVKAERFKVSRKRIT